MSDGTEPIPGQTPVEVVELPDDKAQSPDEEKKAIPVRDRMLAEIERVTSEEDEQKRKESSEKLIATRMAELTGESKPKTLSLVAGSVHNGFIHPESRIMRNFLVDAVRIDDPQIYQVLLESFRQYRENPSWKNKSMREIATYALARTLGEYFGNHYGTSSTEQNNRQFYWDHGSADSEDISISEFRGKKIGVCAEKAAVAQNLLTFMGYETELVMSTNNRLNASETDDREGHAYLILTTDRGHFIHDPTNPIMVKKEDGSVFAVMPSNYPISDEQYRGLVGGGQAEVDHTDLTWDGNSYQKQESVKRIYGGPR